MTIAYIAANALGWHNWSRKGFLLFAILDSIVLFAAGFLLDCVREWTYANQYQEEKEKIFEAFFKGKGIEGRGLGLYICRQFLDRYDYSIDVIDNSEYSLGGADFRIDFNKKDEE